MSKGIINSAKDSQLNYKLIAWAAGILITIGFASQYLWSWGGDDSVVQAQVLEVPTVEPTPTMEQAPLFAAIHATPQVVEVVVTATPTVAPQIVTEYREIYLPSPEIEVTRIVEVTAVPIPTSEPLRLAPGTVEICVRVEGAREIYIGGVGVVSGACSTYSFGVGQTSIQVQVNK